MIRIGIDLGKTSCRARLFDDAGDSAGVVREGRAAGAPGLSERVGIDAAMAAITAACASLRADLPATGIDAIGIGAAGALAAPEASAELARRVRAQYDAPTIVTSDAVAAHAGAFAGREGTLLIVGTGAVAIAVADGRLRRSDGWGPWLGDDGSGQWIGREGLRAALGAFDGRGPASSLAAAAEQMAGPLDGLPAWLAAGEAPAARIAQFAPAVLDAASAADEVAVGICDQAAEALSATAAALGATDIVLHGGITEHDSMRARLDAALDARNLRVVAAQGDACTGAVDLALPGLQNYNEGISRA